MARVPAGPISYRRAPNEKMLRPGVLKPKTGGMKFTQPIMTKPKARIKPGEMKFTQPVTPTPKKSPMNTMRPMAMKKRTKNG